LKFNFAKDIAKSNPEGPQPTILKFK